MVNMGDQQEQQPFDMTVLRSYINEILEYKNVLSYCFGDALRSLIFWRGQVQVVNMLVPLHSLLFFCACCTLIEKPYLAPPFLLLGIAWGHARGRSHSGDNHPSPWSRCPSFWHYLEILRQGESSVSIHSIAINQGEAETQAYEQAWKDRKEKDLKHSATRAALQAQINTIGDESIHTKMGGGIPLDLLERLGRYQGIIGRYCRYFRFANVILTWEEGIILFLDHGLLFDRRPCGPVAAVGFHLDVDQSNCCVGTVGPAYETGR